MISKRKHRIAIAGAVALLGLSLAHAHVCMDLFRLRPHESLPIDSTDTEWTKALESTSGVSESARNKLRHGQAHVLLNRALFPLIGRLHGIATRVSAAEIKTRLATLESDFPIQEGKYERHLARLDKNIVSDAAITALEANSQTIKLYHPEIMGGEAERVFYSKPNEMEVSMLGRLFRMLGATITPVTKVYGDKFTRDLMRTDQILMALVRERLQELAGESLRKNGKVLDAEAFRVAMAEKEEAIREISVLGSVSEGVHTFHQMVSLLTMDRVPGAETGRDALRDIVFGGADRMGLTADFTRRVPLGVVGPATLSGRYFRDALSRNAEGKLELSNRTKEILERFKARIAKNRGNRICPMFSSFRSPAPHDAQTSGVQLVAEAYWHIFNLVSQSSH